MKESRFTPEEREAMSKMLSGAANVIIGIGKVIKNGTSPDADMRIAGGIQEVIDGIEGIGKP